MTDSHQRYDHPHFGIEFDWLACDLDGSVSLMMSAGYGPVPESVYTHSGELDELLDPALERLAVIGGFRLELHPPRTTPYERPAKRGIYCYDWEHWDGPYRRASIPDEPLRVKDLPPELSRLALLVPVPVAFSTCVALDLSDSGIQLAVQSAPEDGA